MSEAQSIQWFPGHMAKTRRKIKEILPLIDAVAEVVDARVPVSSRNPELLSLIGVMVVGIPNVGKSSFINRIGGGNKAKVENRPGVTRGNQWFTVDKQLELLDTPGVLWPKFEDKTVGEHLAFTGAVKDNILDTELLAVRLSELLAAHYPDRLTSRYGEINLDTDGYDILCQIGKKRGMVIRGGETDTERAANMLLEEFRSCKIGNITLERVEESA